MMPYYVMKNGEIAGTFVDDGGITIGYGHHINVKEWENSAEPDHKFLSSYVPANVKITGIKAKKETLPQSGLIVVPQSTMVPIDIIESQYDVDVKLHSKAISDWLIEKNIKVNQKEFDALVIYRYNRGNMSQSAMQYLETGNKKKDDWKKIWTEGRTELINVKNYFLEEIINWKKIKKIGCILVVILSLNACVVESKQQTITSDESENHNVTEIDKISSEINYNQKQNAVYKMFYGTWKFDKVVSQHGRLGGDEGYEKLLGQIVTYDPTYVENSSGIMYDPTYYISIHPIIQGRYNQFFQEQEGLETLLPNKDYFIFVQIEYKKNSEIERTGFEFLIDNDDVMYVLDKNCIYKLIRVNYMPGYNPDEIVTYQERG